MIGGFKPYSEMRESGVGFLEELPAHWKVRRLKDWLQVNEAVLPEDTDPDYMFEYLDIGSVGTGRLVQSPQKLRFEGSPSRARRLVRAGDTIVSTVRTYLKAVWHAEDPRGDLVASTGFAVLSPQSGTCAKFVSYVCQSEPFIARITRDSVGVAYPAIAETRLANFRVGVPPYSEQAAIVRLLDHADDRIQRYIRAKEKLIALLKEQVQAIIHQAVTGQIDVRTGKRYLAYKDSGVEWLGEVPAHWEVAALRFRYSQSLGKMLDTKRITGAHALPYLRNTDVQWDQINLKNLPMMDISPSEYERFTVQMGDLLVCEGGEVGRCAIWAGGISRCGFQKALHRLRPRNARRDLPRFLYYVFWTAVRRQAFYDGQLSTIGHLTGEKLRAHRFPFPTPNEQECLVGVLDRAIQDADQAIRNVRRQIALVREYHARLIADVVTGKVDVRGTQAALPKKEFFFAEGDQRSSANGASTLEQNG